MYLLQLAHMLERRMVLAAGEARDGSSPTQAPRVTDLSLAQSAAEALTFQLTASQARVLAEVRLATSAGLVTQPIVMFVMCYNCLVHNWLVHDWLVHNCGCSQPACSQLCFFASYAGPERHGFARAHAAPAAGRRWLRQDHRGLPGDAGGGWLRCAPWTICAVLVSARNFETQATSMPAPYARPGLPLCIDHNAHLASCHFCELPSACRCTLRGLPDATLLNCLSLNHISSTKLYNLAFFPAVSGFQACLMAPSEVLSQQHVAKLRQLIDSMPPGVRRPRVELMTSGNGGHPFDAVPLWHVLCLGC